MFVSTRASDYVMECLQDNSCVTLTAPSGAGKSFIARHTALTLQKAGYKIVPVIQPDDIRNFYQPGEQTVFIVDDICGNFTANQQQIDNWKQLLPVVDTIIADKCCKIIVSCRQQLIQYLQQLDKVQQVKLANTKDTVEPKESCNSGTTPLVWNCYDGYTDMVQWMLRNDVDVDQCRDDGTSNNGHTDIVRLLLERNPDPCNNSTRISNSPSLVQPLLKHKPDINAQTCDGEYVSKKSVDYAFDVVAGSSPLHIACFMGRINVVRCLIDHKGNINMTKEDGTTPLFYACEVGYKDIVRLLLDNGADTQICRMERNSL
ncbi:Hypothetical predicted protein [Mytilus galloprovincialis]|uniref:Novel STAND NTPase 3 domain-containing protein n=1 Tax=Mytilus galloprovincialis TaxID=29158 RepID=A0A8B6BGC6_MYTGA|nr:Hypothetical predicted protein [Mytilus galloprovincialis]